MAKMTTTPKDEVKPKCAMCGMPYHRYSPDDPQHEYDAIACVNMLRAEIERLRAAGQAMADAIDRMSKLPPAVSQVEYEAWADIEEAREDWR